MAYSSCGYFLLSLTLCACASTAQETTPEYILPCKRNLPSSELNTCLVGTFNHLRPYLSKGLPDLGVPAIEPLHIAELVMENGAGAVRVKARFSDIVVTGPGNYTIKDVRADISQYRLALGLGIPRVEVTGSYEVNGNVLLFPVRSRGDFWAVFTDVNAVARIHGSEVPRNGELYLSADKLLVDFTVKGSRFKVRDTVNHGNIIGEAMNQFLNQNGADIVNEMRPAASQSIAKLFKNFINKAFTLVPINAWLLD